MPTEKFKALTHFLIHECRDNPRKLGAIRLNKALLRADLLAYKLQGQSITGDRYLKRKNGPVPAHILATISELKKEGAILVREPEAQYEPRMFISLETPEEDHLSDDERELAKHALSYICGITAGAASEETHDIIWEAARDGEEIPMYATFASKIGALSPKVTKWAFESIAKAK